MFVCTTCGTPSKQLYSTFPNTGILKIEHCRNCKNVVDKYIEYDVTLLFLDLMLLKPGAFRHILCNRDTGNIHWKLALLCLFCDGYRKWVSRKPEEENTEDTPENGSKDTVFQAATQLQLYMMTFAAGVELSIFALVVLLLSLMFFRLVQRYKCCSALFLQNVKKAKVFVGGICRALLIANCGKLLLLPAIVWAQSIKHVFYVLAHVVCSSALSLSIVTNFSYCITVPIVMCGYVAIYFIQPVTELVYDQNSQFWHYCTMYL